MFLLFSQSNRNRIYTASTKVMYTTIRRTDDNKNEDLINSVLKYFYILVKFRSNWISTITLFWAGLLNRTTLPRWIRGVRHYTKSACSRGNRIRIYATSVKVMCATITPYPVELILIFLTLCSRCIADLNCWMPYWQDWQLRPLIECNTHCGAGRTRTNDQQIFNLSLYHLSYYSNTNREK